MTHDPIEPLQKFGEPDADGLPLINDQSKWYRSIRHRGQQSSIPNFRGGIEKFAMDNFARRFSLPKHPMSLAPGWTYFDEGHGGAFAQVVVSGPAPIPGATDTRPVFGVVVKSSPCNLGRHLVIWDHAGKIWQANGPANGLTLWRIGHETRPLWFGIHEECIAKYRYLRI